LRNGSIENEDETYGRLPFPDRKSPQVARLNVCSFWIDIGRWGAIKASMNQPKLDALAHYRTSPVFTDAERAALDHATEHHDNLLASIRWTSHHRIRPEAELKSRPNLFEDACFRPICDMPGCPLL
jgi:hypothetical protein